MKRIFLTVTNDLNNDQRMNRICNSLLNAGYDITLIGRSKKTSKELENKSYKQVRIQCKWEKGKLFYVEFNWKLKNYLIKNKPDIICSIDLDTLFAGYFASKKLLIPLVYDSHEYFTEVPELINRPFTRFFWVKLEQYILPKIKYAYTVSTSIAKIYSEKYAVDFKVIRNVPLYTDLQLSPKNKPFILYQGALNKGRGLEQLVESMQQISVPLYIAGDGDLNNLLKHRVVDLKLQEKVFFLGMISPQKLKDLTQNAYLGINVLEHLGDSYYYSLANKYFDYIHALVPSISCNFPEYNVLNSTYNVGLLIDNLTVSELVKNITKLLNDKELYHNLQHNCQLAKQELSWQTEEKQLLAVYKSING